MNFYTLFTRAENVHLLKDVGMVPETLAAEFSDVNSYLVTYKNGEYPYIGKDIKNMKMIFLKKRLGKYIDGILFIMNSAKDIDVLNIYHLNLSSFIYCIAAKIFLKKEAKVYLKLDLGPAEIEKIRKKDIRSWIKKKTIEMADIVTGETSILVNQLNEEVNSKIKLIPNGYYNPFARMSDFTKKKNRIITVGRLGAEPKNTELLVDAFVERATEHDWELRLIGPYTDKLYEKVNEIMKRVPQLSGRIKLTGEITDKEMLSKEYEEAKVFAFPSKWESFGLVLTEALMAGDYLIVSDAVPAAYDLIDSDEIGKIIKSEDTYKWTEAIGAIVNMDFDYKKMCKDGYNKANAQFNWVAIAKNLRETLIML